jgi:thiol-disulfide isomerase/thioredoxin
MERTNKAILWIAILLTMLLLAACSSTDAGKPFQDSMAPDFRATTTGGEEISLIPLQGKIVVLNFWAMWCGPCLEEIPELNSFHGDHQADVTLISVEIDGTRIALDEFRGRIPIDFPVILNAQQSVDLANLYQIQAIPTTFVIDSEGKIAARLTGSITQETLESKIP